jgi:hypothetical protein
VAKRESNLIFYLVALGAAVAAFAYSQKETIVLYGSKVMEAGNELLFKLSLPDYAQGYADLILQVSRETGVDPYILFAIGDRESNWGTQLRQGTGDWTARSGSAWGKTPGAKVVTTLPPGWSAGKLAGPWAIPADGLGWGRGLMQLDLQNSLGVDWTDPLTNIREGAALYQQHLNFFAGNATIPGYTDGSVVSITSSASRLGVDPGDYPDPRPLQGEDLAKAAAAAYNAGDASVLMSIATAQSPDLLTTGGDYSDDSWRRLAAATANLSVNSA